MKDISPALKAHYASGTTTLATCVKATLTNGTVVATTSHDTDLPIDGVLYLAAAGYLGSDVESSAALNPDNLEISGFMRAPAITEEDIHSGLWDYAAIEMFEVNYADLTMGKNVLRTGTLGEVKGGRSKFTAELRGLMQAYSRTIVRLTTKDCSTDLGSGFCKINLAAWTVAGTVGSVSDNRVINDGARGESADWFVGGKLTFTSGLNAGLSMEVKQSTAGQIRLHERMPFEIVVGDAYSVYAGCTKRHLEDCRDKFNNVVNFRGFPYVPGPKIYRVGKQGISETDTTGGSGGSTGGSGTDGAPTAPGSLTGTVAATGSGTGTITASVIGAATGYVTGIVTGTGGSGTIVGTATPNSDGTSTVTGTVTGSVTGTVTGSVRQMTPAEIAAIDTTPTITQVNFTEGAVTGGQLTSTFAGRMSGAVTGYVQQINGDQVTFSGASVYNGDGTSTITAPIALTGTYAGFDGHASLTSAAPAVEVRAYKPALWDGSRFLSLAISSTDIPGNGGQRSATSTSGTGNYQILPSVNLGDDIMMAYGNGRYVAANITNTFAVSTDRQTWQQVQVRSFPQHNMTGAPNLTGLAFVGGRFVALSEYLIIMESPDGLTWTETNSSLSMPGGHSQMYLHDVAFDGSNYVVVGYETGTSGVTIPIIYRGANLTNMVRVTAPTAGPKNDMGGWGALARVMYRNGAFIAIGSRLHTESSLLSTGARTQAYILRSTDGGATWADVSFYGSLIRNKVGPSSGVADLWFVNGRYIAVGSNVDATSADGITWTEHPHVGINRLYSATNGSILIVNEFNGNLTAPYFGNTLVSTTDGVTWSPVNNVIG